MQISVPAAFLAVAEGGDSLERRVRLQCRDLFHGEKLLERVIRDIERALELTDLSDEQEEGDGNDPDTDPALPGNLWDPGHPVTGGQNLAEMGQDGVNDLDATPKQPQPFPEDDIPF